MRLKTRLWIPKQAMVPVLWTFLATYAVAQHKPEETKTDIARHRAMAAAHTQAAKCLESGKTEEVCLKELQAACKGLGIGKYCGMKHEH